MPEAPEIRAMTDFVNYISKFRKYVKLEIMPISKNKDISFKSNPFILTGQSVGKEIILTCDFETHKKNILLNMGMSGEFYFCDKANWPRISKNVVLRFEGTDGSYLCIHDVRRFAKWREGMTSGKNRGPDPFDDPINFKENVVFNFFKDKLFQKNFIFECMLNQKYFNGIGTYLNSVILYRANENPFQSGYDYIKKYGEKLFEILFQTINESYELQKQGKTIDPEWYYPYRLSEYVMTKGGRKFWFDKKWNSFRK